MIKTWEIGPKNHYDTDYNFIGIKNCRKYHLISVCINDTNLPIIYTTSWFIDLLLN
jgi:hypothetical protein